MAATRRPNIARLSSDLSHRFGVPLVLLALQLLFLAPAGAEQSEPLTSTLSFPVGDFPEAVVFDGAHIWTANGPDDSVTKLRPSDGSIVGTFPVGDFPKMLTFDGTYIWTTNISDGTLTKLRASDGATVGTFPAIRPLCDPGCWSLHLGYLRTQRRPQPSAGEQR